MKSIKIDIDFLFIIKRVSFILFTMMLLYACQSEEINLNGIVGSKAPEFTLTSLEGKQVDLFDYSNKIVVLYFFGNNCPYCKAEASEIEDSLVDPYLNRSDYVFFGLDYWNGSMSDVQMFQKETGVSFPLLLDASNVATNYNTTYNRIVIIDKNKDVVFSGTQNVSMDLKTIKSRVEILLAN